MYLAMHLSMLLYAVPFFIFLYTSQTVWLSTTIYLDCFKMSLLQNENQLTCNKKYKLCVILATRLSVPRKLFYCRAKEQVRKT